MSDFGMGMVAFLNPEFYVKIKANEREYQKRRLDRLIKDGAAEPWDPMKTKWKRELVLDAATWSPHYQFDVEPSTDEEINSMSKCVHSPTDKWRYINQILPKGRCLKLIQGNRTNGWVW